MIRQCLNSLDKDCLTIAVGSSCLADNLSFWAVLSAPFPDKVVGHFAAPHGRSPRGGIEDHGADGNQALLLALAGPSVKTKTGFCSPWVDRDLGIGSLNANFRSWRASMTSDVQ